MTRKKCKQYYWKIRAGALQYTIAFSLLVILVLVSFLLFNHLRKVELSQYELFDKLESDISSARLIIEAQPKLFGAPEREIKLDDGLFLKELDIKVKEWGFLHTVSISVNHKNMKRKKTYLYSDDIHLNKLQPSLYLSDPRKHLSIGGKAYLGNNTYLPPHGIREAYINGIKYQRNSLVHGTSRKADTKLPKLKGKWVNMYNSLNDGISKKDSILNWNDIKSGSIVNSFSNKRLVIRCPNKVIIDRKIIIGNVVLHGNDIEIRNTSSLESCIVLAKSITIDSKFKGAAQFIAENNIEVQKGSILMYPSVLFCSVDSKEEGIMLEDNCKVEGDIILASSQKHLEVLKTGRDSKVIGQIYCHGIVTFHGNLLGSMYCRGFIDRTKEGVFSNYIYDVLIDIDRLPKEYGGISLITQANGKKCIQEVI